MASTLPMVLSLAKDLERFSPFYDEPPYFMDFWRGPRRSNGMILSVLPRDFEIPKIGKDGFQVCMDVTQFKPSELDVKVVENSIVVEGKHEEREDDQGYISRRFVRRYAIPEGYDPDKVMSTLSSDGVLCVSIQNPTAIEDKSKGRDIQIQQTGPAHLNVKSNPQEEDPRKDEQAQK